MIRGMPMPGRTFLRQGWCRDVHAGHIGAVDHVLLDGVREHVSGCLAGIHVETRDTHGVVVVELQPGALGVGVEECHGIRCSSACRDRQAGRFRHCIAFGTHVRHVPHADTLRVRRVFTGRGDPLVRVAVADPHGVVAVEVDRGPVLRVLARPRYPAARVLSLNPQRSRPRAGRGFHRLRWEAGYRT